MANKKIVVSVQGLRNDRGEILIGLFDGPEGFPTQPAKHRAKVEIVRGRAEAVFESLPAGRYAVGLTHDENGDGKLDKNLLGIPKEGFGVSGYNDRLLGMPEFETAAFDYDGTETTVPVHVHYLGRV